MKKIIFAIAAAFSLTTANAQEVPQKKREMPNPETQATAQVEKLNQMVTLTEAQKPKVYELTLAQVKASNELRAKPRVEGEDPTEKRKQMQAIKTDYVAKLKTVLTPEQFAKVNEGGKAASNAAPAVEKTAEKTQ